MIDLRPATAALADQLDQLRFTAPVTHVYNPLRYAHAPHEQWLQRHGNRPREIVLLGMNPGPWGMAQTGVPFGVPAIVRDWLQIQAAVDSPPQPHPRRPISGFACERVEVSGQRFWGWAQQRFGSADAFFQRLFVINYCPLMFMEESGRNRTPDKLKVAERRALFAACDEALRSQLAQLKPTTVLGIGAFAEGRARAALKGWNGQIGRLPHPSPASPAANRGWAALMEAAIEPYL